LISSSLSFRLVVSCNSKLFAEDTPGFRTARRPLLKHHLQQTIARYPGQAQILQESLPGYLISRNTSCKPCWVSCPCGLLKLRARREPSACDCARQRRDAFHLPLSHCWGGEKPMKCLSSSMVSLGTARKSNSVRVAIFIQDAATVCQGLDLYLDRCALHHPGRYQRSIHRNCQNALRLWSPSQQLDRPRFLRMFLSTLMVPSLS